MVPHLYTHLVKVTHTARSFFDISIAFLLHFFLEAFAFQTLATMKIGSIALWSASMLLKHAVALPHIDPDAPISLDTFRLGARDGFDPHFGIDPETIRKYASQAPNITNLRKRVTEFDPEKQLVDGKLKPFQPSMTGKSLLTPCQCTATTSSLLLTSRLAKSAVFAQD